MEVDDPAAKHLLVPSRFKHKLLIIFVIN